MSYDFLSIRLRATTGAYLLKLGPNAAIFWTWVIDRLKDAPDVGQQLTLSDRVSRCTT